MATKNIVKVLLHTRYALPASLVLLFSYAAVSKLLDFRGFETQMQVQPFPLFFARLLAFLLPITELITVVLLVVEPTRRYGLLLAAILLTAFTGYTALAWAGFWEQTPCPCGGILGQLSWGPHFAFNLFFLLVTIISIITNKKERRAGDP